MIGLFILIILEFGLERDALKNNEKVVVAFGVYKFAFILDILVSTLLATISSLLDVFVLHKLFKRRPFWFILLFGFITQTLMILLIIDVADHMLILILETISKGKIEALSAVSQGSRVVILTVTVLLGKIFVEIDRKLGPGNLRRMLTGRFHSPREEERIFMFVDLKDSTPLAVELGHLKYSQLLQDCFYDFSIVDKYEADIYQYVGDEVVISWKLKNGFKNDNFINAFFAFITVINSRAEYYKDKYNVVPYFKAGVNVGPVIITEVGSIKQEITYHGDTLNTAARIQGKCNDLNAQFLIPNALYESVKSNSNFLFKNLGATHLKGKEKGISLYGVSKKAT